MTIRRFSQIETAENFLLSAEDWNKIKQSKYSGQDYSLLWVLVRKLNGRYMTSVKIYKDVADFGKKWKTFFWMQKTIYLDCK